MRPSRFAFSIQFPDRDRRGIGEEPGFVRVVFSEIRQDLDFHFRIFLDGLEDKQLNPVLLQAG